MATRFSSHFFSTLASSDNIHFSSVAYHITNQISNLKLVSVLNDQIHVETKHVCVVDDNRWRLKGQFNYFDCDFRFLLFFLIPWQWMAVVSGIAKDWWCIVDVWEACGLFEEISIETKTARTASDPRARCTVAATRWSTASIATTKITTSTGMSISIAYFGDF